MFQFFRVCMLILLMCLGWGCADKQVDPCSLVECGVGFKCIEGRCVSDCPSGMILCGGLCADVSFSNIHCGSCGNECAKGETCIARQCESLCSSNETLCSDTCVDTKTDLENCGSCGNKCGASAKCEGGTCTLSCPLPLSKCGGDCVNLVTSREHCGTCGKACQDGEICEAGACILNCQSGLLACDGKCVDATVNPNHCGACGKACTGGAVCTSGTCESKCPTGQTNCSGSCVNTQESLKHCGACGKACQDGEICSAGVCKKTGCASGKTLCLGTCTDLFTDVTHCGACGNACGSGQLCCQGVCRDTKTDTAHCGACGLACGTGQICQGGSCDCPSGLQQCSGQCVDTSNDPKHCGGCGAACQSGETCSSGKCGVVCKAGQTNCSGSCVDVQQSLLHCGGCGKTCGSGASACNNGQCACPSGLSYCSNACVNTQSELKHCGGCGKSCGAGAVSCQGGECICPSGKAYCSGRCIDILSDTNNCGGCGKTCPTGEKCTNGTCGVVCTGGGVKCGNICVDTRSDLKHCGGCNKACGSGATSCITGQCVCPSGEGYCNGNCIDILSDTKNCGGCGKTCPSGEVCNAGTCKPPVTASSIQLYSGRTSFTHCLVSSGKAKCWGDNTKGELGIGTTSRLKEPSTKTIDVGAGRTVKQMALGRYHVCAILDNGSVKCWGYNAYGQLGYGNTTTLTRPSSNTVNLGTGRTAVQIAAGYYTTCVVLDDATAKCWGKNNDGQLGIGNTIDQKVPPSTPINVGAGRTVKKISAARDVVCALLDNNSIKCWGEGQYGTLGLGNVDSLKAPGAAISFGTLTAKDLECGRYHCCAILSDDSMRCWGQGGDGQLGNGAKANANAPQSTSITGLGPVMQIGTAYQSSCALMKDGTLKCWGYNRYGHLGQGNTTSLSQPPTTAIDVGTGRSVKQFGLGRSSVCALLDDNTVKCWGRNDYNQLGYGDSTHRYKPSATTIVF